MALIVGGNYDDKSEEFAYDSSEEFASDGVDSSDDGVKIDGG